VFDVNFAPGTTKLESKRNQNASSWKASLGERWTSEISESMHQIFHGTVPNASATTFNPSRSSWLRCKYVVSRSGDICKEKSWVFIQTEEVSTNFFWFTYTANLSSRTLFLLVVYLGFLRLTAHRHCRRAIGHLLALMCLM